LRHRAWAGNDELRIALAFMLSKGHRQRILGAIIMHPDRQFASIELQSAYTYIIGSGVRIILRFHTWPR
jgi:NOL1/NOP2/fmu family ribosome biogenesis protein